MSALMDQILEQAFGTTAAAAFVDELSKIGAYSDDGSKTYPISRFLSNPAAAAVIGGLMGVGGSGGSLMSGAVGATAGALGSTAMRGIHRRGMQGRANMGGGALTDAEKETLIHAAERIEKKASHEVMFEDRVDHRALCLLREAGAL